MCHNISQTYKNEADKGRLQTPIAMPLFETSIDQLCSVLSQSKALAQTRIFKLGTQKSNQGLGHHIFQKYKDNQQN